jgi:hypothetical protein
MNERIAEKLRAVLTDTYIYCSLGPTRSGIPLRTTTAVYILHRYGISDFLIWDSKNKRGGIRIFLRNPRMTGRASVRSFAPSSSQQSQIEKIEIFDFSVFRCCLSVGKTWMEDCRTTLDRIHYGTTQS